jgi:hypothetical protein
MIEPSHHAAKATGPAQAPAVFEEPSMTEVTIDNVTEPKIAFDGLDDSIASLPVPSEQVTQESRDMERQKKSREGTAD